MNSDDFFDQEREPARVGGRYRLPHPETGAEQSWTAATTHAGLPEDSYALARWQLRQLLKGLRRRPDLLRLIESWNEDPDRDELDQVIGTAHEVAGNDAQANMGTAVHGALQRVDRSWATAPVTQPTGHEDWTRWFGEVGVPEWALPHARGYVDELARHGLTPIPAMVERRVVNLDLGCAGTLDNLYQEADGTVALGDKKTGRLDYPERKYAIQLAVYHGAGYLLDEAGGPPVDLRSVGLRREYAVLVYVDPESGACSIYRVDMRRGQHGANLAAEVREWRRQRHFLLPYVAPTAVARLDNAGATWAAAERAESGRHLQLVHVGPEPTVTHDAVRVLGTDQHGNMRLAFPPAADGTEKQPSADPGTHAVSGGLADEPERPAPYTREALERMNKASLQGVLRKLDPGATVAHQRRILIDKILTVYAGGQVATSTPAAQTSRVVSNANEPPVEDPTDPRTRAFHRLRLGEIAAARSVAELGRIHARVVKIGGDQAWTEELTEAARTRTAHLDAVNAAAGPTVEWRGRAVPVPQAIGEAGSSQEMTEVWKLVTIGGSAEDRWTEELHQLALARLAAIDDEIKKTRPSSPFGP